VPQPASVAARRELGSPMRPEQADRFIDELLPSSIDWRHLVDRYPLACVGVASLAGFLLARSKGGVVMAALGSYVAAQFGEAIAELGDDAQG
jgi:hypothetical protein